MFRYLQLLSLSFLASCSSSKLEHREYSASKDNSVISLSYGGAWTPQTRYIVDGVHACREISSPHTDTRTGITSFAVSKQEEVIPSAEQWQVFWKIVRELRVPEWRSSYTAKQLGYYVFDGLQWYLRYSQRSKERVTDGDNAYPVRSDPYTLTLKSDSLDALASAFDSLFPTLKSEFCKLR